MGTNLLEFSMSRDLGAIKGLTCTVQPSIHLARYL